MSFNEPVRGRCHFAENPAELFSAREISLNFDIALAASVTIENVISRTIYVENDSSSGDAAACRDRECFGYLLFRS